MKFLEDVKSELTLLRNRYASTVALGRTGTSSAPSGVDFTNSHVKINKLYLNLFLITERQVEIG